MMLEQLREILGEERVLPDEPMKLHTTFRVGGPARYLVEPQSVQELRAVIDLCHMQKMPWYIVGNGSNLLVSDEGYNGVVIHLFRNVSQMRAEETHLVLQAGVQTVRAAKFALEHSLTGLEFASGIPGTIGGAMVMNAGAYGGEMKDVVRWVRVLLPDGTERDYSGGEMQFGYRRSRVASEGGIVLEAELELAQGDAESIRARMEELKQKRLAKQPLEYPSAGSTFKRPEGYFAGKLIEEAQLRGFRVGGAQVSEKHCGFVINRGDATASQIWELIGEVQRRVYEHSGVRLEPEVKLLGFDGKEIQL
ncbi:MAG: UDP-N-acetylmuramate dehydrogenase [Lachnospiraceae bacterium]|nr:UDP-N-acetylmuramate dehydrogenase [Lachnospiraceae bacterium]